MKPSTVSELAECITSASEPLVIIGGGTRPVGRPQVGQFLSTAELTGISRYEPEALTLVASAGTPLSHIEENLSQHRQRLAFEPMDHRCLLGTEGQPTIGGTVAGNVNGPRRIQSGACRDHLLGIQFVDGSGKVIRNGGRVMKNVTGYDLVRLLAGSFGTLGVLTEVAIKVLPDCESCAVVLIYGLSDREAIRALSIALKSPYEVTGAAHAPVGVDNHPVTMIRLEGFEDSVRYRSRKVKELLAEFDEISIETDAEKTAAGWKWVRDVELFHDREGDVWRISVKPSDGPGVVATLKGQTDASILYDWGGGLIWALVTEGVDVRKLCGKMQGHATLVRASPEVRSRLQAFHPQVESLQMLADGIKRQFDPRNILNPGLMS